MVVNRQSGFTLVEIMVSLLISLVLLNGVIQIFLSSKQTYRFGEAVSRLQESGRFAIDIMARDIRMAGYQGCADLSSVPLSIISKAPPTNNLNQDAVQGWEYDGSAWAPSSPARPNDVAAKALADSDVFSIQHAQDQGIQLTGNMTPNNANIQIASDTIGIEKDDILIISDCESADIFTTEGVSSGSGKKTISHPSSVNISNKLSKSYGTEAKVYAFAWHVYFVGDTGRKNSRGQNIMALFRRDIDGNIEEVVEGVENMQVTFGERANNGNIRYVPSDDGTLDVTKVVSVRIGLLLQSIEPVNDSDDNQTYNVAGTLIAPAGSSGVTHAVDKRLRRVFVTTVKLRNRR